MTEKRYKRAIELTRIFSNAVKKAQKENHEKGLPNIYYKNGRIIYELPDGTYTYEYDFDND